MGIQQRTMFGHKMESFRPNSFLNARSVNMVGRAYLGILLGALACSVAVGQQPNPQPSLSAAARAAAGNFQPVPAQEVAAARAQFAAAVSNLDAFLRSGGAYKLNGWQKYLQWNDL